MRTILVIVAILFPACATTSPSHKVEKDDQEYLVAKSVPAGESDVKITPPPPEPKKQGDALFNLILLAGAVVAIDALVDDDDDEKDENPCKKLPTVWDAKLGSYVVDTKRVKEDDLKKCLEYQEEQEKKKEKKKEKK